MKLLIIDDDIQTVDFMLSAVDYQRLGFNRVLSAYNIQRAQKHIQEYAPEIIISDIEMPMGSGIDLIKWVRQNRYQCELIFLTNYEEFEFARAAVKYNACDYITKPISADRLEDAVLHAIEKRTKVVEYESLDNRLVRRYPFAREQLLRDLLFKNIGIGTEEIPAISNLICVSLSYKEENFSNYDIRICIASLFTDVDPESIVECRTSSRMMMWFLAKPEANRNTIITWCKRLTSELKDRFLLQALCYVVQNCPVDSMHEVCMRIEANIPADGYGNTCVFIDIEKTVTTSDSVDTNELLLLYAEGTREKLLLWFQERIEKYTFNHMVDKIVLDKLKEDFLQITYTYLHNSGIQAHSLFASQEYRVLIGSECSSVIELMRLVDIISNCVINSVEHLRENQSIIEKAKAYINDHFCESISRDIVASYVGLSPGYFSRLFKMEEGISFIEYLNRCRINRAKYLLINGDMSVSDVAFAVGYNNYTYFSNVFKSYETVSPNLIRRKGASKNSRT